MNDAARFQPSELIEFATALFSAAGMPGERSAVVAELLVEADLMGHDTHGLNLAANYLGQLDKGTMKKTGDPVVVNDRGPCLTLNGEYLNGVWLTAYAIEEAVTRAREFGLGVVAVQQSHHIACLATFLPLATRHGMVIQLLSSDPAETGVTPHGGVEGCFTPNPIAVGYPTDGDPVLIDISASITTLGMSGRLRGAGEPMTGKWAVGPDGKATDDPGVLVADPPGALLPLGGLETGHKGFGLALMVEAMTSGLAGHGRADGPERHGASVFIQVLDPDAFGGRDRFVREASFLAERCRAARVAPGNPAVRLPGDGALARRAKAMRDGVSLYPGIMPALEPFAEGFGIAMPSPLA